MKMKTMAVSNNTQPISFKIFFVTLAVMAIASISIGIQTATGAGSLDLVQDDQTYGARTSNFQTGATLTQYSLDPWGDAAAIANGKTLLESSTHLVVQHIHGFGAIFPRLEDGSYNWKVLDRRFDDSLAGMSNIVLTAACAPAYMEEPDSNNSDPGDFSPYLRPKPEYYDAYADTVLKTVQRYPAIKYIQVWNEMKGFWNQKLNRWDYEAYTQLYNKVWDTVKAVRPDIKIGGPYVVLNSYGGSQWFNSDTGGEWGYYDQRDLDVVEYWLRHKNGADFITVDGKNQNRDGIEHVDAFERTKKFGVFMTWLRGLDDTIYTGARTLPVWWAEWYALTDDDTTASQAEKNATMAAGLIRTLRSGADTAIIWGPQGDKNGDSFPLGIFSDTQIADGGQATAFYGTQKYLNDHFSAGTIYFDHTGSNDNIESLLSNHHLLMVNMTNEEQTTVIKAHDYTLSAYEVRLENAPDIAPLAVRISSPKDNSVVEGVIEITAVVDDVDACAYIEFSIDGSIVSTNNAAPYTFSWDTTKFNNGHHTLTVMAYDEVGRSASDACTITVDNPGEGDSEIPQSAWTLHYVSSEETSKEDGSAVNAFDGDNSTIWHTEWAGSTNPTHPHEIQINLGASYKITGFKYLPRTDWDNGTIAGYQIYVSTDGVDWGTAVKTGTWSGTDEKTEVFAAKTGSYVRLVATSEINDKIWTSAAEINVIGDTPPRVDPIEDGSYIISIESTGGALTADGDDNGSNIINSSYSGGRSQNWDVINLGDGSYKIINSGNGKAADSFGTENSDNIGIWEYHGRSNQKWIITRVSPSAYKIIDSRSSRAMDAYHGGNVGLWDFHGGYNQLWKFTPVTIEAGQ